MKKYLLLMLVLFASNSFSSNFRGVVEKMIVGSGEHRVYVHLKGAPKTCDNDHPLGFNYAFSLRDHGAGREIFSSLLAAQMAGKEVTVQGNSQCTVSTDMEDIGYIYTY